MFFEIEELIQLNLLKNTKKRHACIALSLVAGFIPLEFLENMSFTTDLRQNNCNTV